MECRKKTVFITGGSAGVGRATARLFARKGWNVSLLARGRERLESAKKEIEACGVSALACPADVAHFEQVEQAAQRTEEHLGPIDVWINCAMTTVFGRFLSTTPEEFKRATEVTYLGYVNGTMAALKRMVPRDSGTIVQVGSALAYRAIPLQSSYCGAKHAIRGFTDSVRTELLHDKSKVHLTMVQLPALNTPQFDWCRNKMPRKSQPVPPIYQPEVAARAILWSAYHRRRELFVGSSTSVVIWGNKFLPGIGDKYLAKTGFSSQQYDGPDDPNRPDNLFDPVPGQHAAGGSFGDRSRPASLQAWLTTRPGYPYWSLAALGLLGYGALKSLGRMRRMFTRIK